MWLLGTRVGRGPYFVGTGPHKGDCSATVSGRERGARHPLTRRDPALGAARACVEALHRAARGPCRSLESARKHWPPQRAGAGSLATTLPGTHSRVCLLPPVNLNCSLVAVLEKTPRGVVLVCSLILAHVCPRLRGGSSALHTFHLELCAGPGMQAAILLLLRELWAFLEMAPSLLSVAP